MCQIYDFMDAAEEPNGMREKSVNRTIYTHTMCHMKRNFFFLCPTLKPIGSKFWESINYVEISV